MINPDQEFVRNLKKRIKANSGFCPCKIDRIRGNKCPCLDYRTKGECECGMYIKPLDEAPFAEAFDPHV